MHWRHWQSWILNIFNSRPHFRILANAITKTIPTAFTVPGLGQFEWIGSPMDLLGCPASIQRLEELAMRGLVNVIVYIDGLLVHSKNHAEHQQQLEKLFCRLRNTGLKANISKCEFGYNNVSYLGSRLTPFGILQTQSCKKQ